MNMAFWTDLVKKVFLNVDFIEKFYEITLFATVSHGCKEETITHGCKAKIIDKIKSLLIIRTNQ